MDLDVDVARLKMLKADFLSQRYALEDDIIKRYPEKTKALEERISGYEADIAAAASNEPAGKDSFSVVIGGKGYSERKAAGEAVLALAEKMTTPEPFHIGNYKGLPLELSFDTVSHEYVATICGKLRHDVPLGQDALGNVARLDNAIAALPAKLEGCKEQLANTKTQRDNAREQAAKPFDKEAELVEKSARLAELDALLDMDDKGEEVIDGDRDSNEPDIEPEREKNGFER